MKRYKAINFEYDDAYGTGTALDIVEHDEGEFVKYDDIKHLLQNTSSNSDYVKCGCGEKATIMLCNTCYKRGSKETQDYPDFA